jgi:hypothetical protein
VYHRFGKAGDGNRAMAESLHTIIKASLPILAPETW